MSTVFEEQALRDLADAMRELPEFKGHLFDRIRQLREKHKREVEELKLENETLQRIAVGFLQSDAGPDGAA